MTDLTLDTRIGYVAASLPGAAGLFHRSGISLCCGAGQTLAAADDRGLDTEGLLAGLQALQRYAAAEVPDETDALIDQILTRYHATHRAELEDLIPLAAKVETVHAEHEEAPQGLVDLLMAMHDEMQEHMAKEEQVLFPLMRSRGQGRWRPAPRPRAHRSPGPPAGSRLRRRSPRPRGVSSRPAGGSGRGRCCRPPASPAPASPPRRSRPALARR